MIANKNKTLTQKLLSLIKFKLFALILISFVCIIYLMDLQIQSLSLEIKNLLPLIECLEKTQTELKNQLIFKDQQIKVLETTINTLKTNLSTLSYLNETQNFEIFKNEVIKANTAEITHFYLKLTGIVVSFVLVLVLANNFKESLFSEIIELKFVDPVNHLMWLVKIPDGKKIDLIIKKIDANDHDQVVECVKTMVIKTADTYLRGSPDGIELISSSVPVSERVIAATQISEILSSTGIGIF